MRLPKQHVISASCVVDFRYCPRFWLWRDFFGLRRSGHREPEALTIGQAFHGAIRSWLDTGEVGYTPASSEPVDDPQQAREVEKAIRAGVALARSVISAYPRFFEDIRERMILLESPLLFDVTRLVPTLATGKGILVGGTPDVVVEQDRGWGIIDWKTTSYRPADALLPYRWSVQRRLYESLVGAAFATPEKPVSVLWLVAVRKPTIRPRKGETDEEYMQRVEEWAAGRDVHGLLRLDSEGGVLHEDLSGVARAVRISQHMIDSGVWHDSVWEAATPRFSHACWSRGRLCEYFELCDFPSFAGALVHALVSGRWHQAHRYVEEDGTDD